MNHLRNKKYKNAGVVYLRDKLLKMSESDLLKIKKAISDHLISRGLDITEISKITGRNVRNERSSARINLVIKS